jgi:hypothetical protein
MNTAARGRAALAKLKRPSRFAAEHARFHPAMLGSAQTGASYVQVCRGHGGYSRAAREGAVAKRSECAFFVLAGSK